MIYPSTVPLLLAISSESLRFAGQTSQGWRQTLENSAPNLDQYGTGDSGGGGGGYIFQGMSVYVVIMKPSEQDSRLCKPVGYWHYTVGAE